MTTRFLFQKRYCQQKTTVWGEAELAQRQDHSSQKTLKTSTEGLVSVVGKKNSGYSQRNEGWSQGPTEEGNRVNITTSHHHQHTYSQLYLEIKVKTKKPALPWPVPCCEWITP